MASERLEARGCTTCVTAVVEPGRLREARDELEQDAMVDRDWLTSNFPPVTARVVITHTRPEPMLGILRTIDTGPLTTRALGYLNRGGTLDANGMLFANRSTWAHVVAAAAKLLGGRLDQVLNVREAAAIAGAGRPEDLFTDRT